MRGFYIRGFGIVEMLIVVGIIAILAVFSYSAFVNANQEQALEKDFSRAVAALERARSLTLASLGQERYGVHFDETQAVIFPGDTYATSTPGNQIETFGPRAKISSVALFGGGSDVVFERLTGEALKSGSIIFSLVSDPTRTKTITIQSTGLIEAN